MNILLLTSKQSGNQFVYRTLAALLKDTPYENIGASQSTLEKHDFKKEKFENNLVVIEDKLLMGSKEVELKQLAAKLFEAKIEFSIRKDGLYVSGKKIDYKKGFAFEGKKYKAIEDVMKILSTI